ncbi:MAG TPA: KH domain-containing protein [Silvibacterium sp.]|nr:KH domain-containing protein [Silvibacterium sp.]
MTHEDRPDDMQELVTEIARALVDEPDAVTVEAVKRTENTVLRLRVAPADVGKVIGKQGRTARSMRTILGAVSMKYHHRYTLDILEEDKNGPPDRQSDA